MRASCHSSPAVRRRWPKRPPVVEERTADERALEGEVAQPVAERDIGAALVFVAAPEDHARLQEMKERPGGGALAGFVPSRRGARLDRNDGGEAALQAPLFAPAERGIQTEPGPRTSRLPLRAVRPLRERRPAPRCGGSPRRAHRCAGALFRCPLRRPRRRRPRPAFSRGAGVSPPATAASPSCGSASPAPSSARKRAGEQNA